jgi:hypothetical protein
MSGAERQQEVLNILGDLRDLDGLKRLFWQELNYERENKPLSPRQLGRRPVHRSSESEGGSLGEGGWPDGKEPWAEPPVVFASGGQDRAFHIIYTHLAGDTLPRGVERVLVNQLLRDHPYALFVFSNKQQFAWHFLNVKFDEQAEKRRLVRRITVRQGEGLRTAAERLALLDRSDKSGGSDSPLAIQARHDRAFDVEQVTKDFYREVANWYFWALKHVEFPKDAPKEKDGRDHISVIRLITRLIFCWFIREKGLIPDVLFDRRRLAEMLEGFAPDKEQDTDSVFYRAILQNLFFATLNTEMDQRGWRREDQNFMAHCLYRHKECFRDPKAALAWFKDIPFLNGGLFECLDKDFGEGANSRYLRVDGFSDRPDSRPTVPDFLFFGPEQEVNLSEDYGDKKFAKVRVRGLIDTLNRYKFTIEENTPFDQEVALDPELCGKVFENLLAAYNPETGTTARKATGSFYTPREIVDYMVDEALVAFLANKSDSSDKSDLSDESGRKLRALLGFGEEPHGFSEAEVERLIEKIDRLKALDPAVGSGAFPMGILHKLVHVLGKLDPDNARWKAKQIAKLDDAVMREEAERVFRDNYDNYGRKLYLTENCIYGVDIQPIAVQIAKMRFFISLMVDQKVRDDAPNRGVRALPNLETKFVAANTLIGIEKPKQMLLRNPEIDRKEAELRKVREQHFTAKTPKAKARCRELDKKLRAEIADLLKTDGWDNATAKQLAAWDPYDQNASSPFFDSEWMFGVREGFDVVIGNPPYGRILSVGAETHLMCSYPAFGVTKDAYVAFMLHGFHLLREGGYESYIVPSAWLGGPGYELLRTDVLRQTIHQVIALPFDMFAAAYVDNIVFLIAKESPKKTHAVRVFSYAKRDEVGEFRPEPWERIAQAEWDAMSKRKMVLSQAVLRLHHSLMAKGNRTLTDVVEMRRGVLFDLNILTERKTCASSFRYFEGDVYRYEMRASNRRWAELGPKMKEYPKDDKWFRSERILLRRLVNRKQRLMATLVDDDFVTNKNLYAILPKENSPGLKCLLAFLNSTLLSRLYIDAVSQAVKDDFPQVTIIDLLGLPFPAVVPAPAEDRLTTLVTRILSAKSADPSADTSAWEREIDQIVYRLYGLTAEEIAIVEGGGK